jgi:hypothetical protein
MRTIIILISLAAVVAAVAAPGCGGGGSREDEQARDAAVEAAKLAYAQAQREGVDMANGPCLGVVLPDWVADVAHDPRRPVDDDPHNQCAAYRSGQAHHFVELDPEGNLIRAQ